MTGTCIKWIEGRGFGFIRRTDDGVDFFVHQSDLDMPGFRCLAVGERVEFDLIGSERGPKAIGVRVIQMIEEETSP